MNTLRTTPIEDVIAEERLIAVIGAERKEILLQIGRPYRLEDGVARTPVASWGLDDRNDIYGEGTLQSLNIACQFLATRLADELQAGHLRLFVPEDQEHEITMEDLDALFASRMSRR